MKEKEKKLYHTPKPGEFYCHFEGNLYQILTIAVHTETKETLVIYQALYGQFQVFACSLETFWEIMENGNSRFIKVDSPLEYNLEKEERNNSQKEKTIEEINKESIVSKPLDKQKEVYDLMEKFYDTDSYDEKLDYLFNMRGQLNDMMLTNIAISLDIVAEEGTLEERFQSIVSCLKTMKKYQGNRLR